MRRLALVGLIVAGPLFAAEPPPVGREAEERRYRLKNTVVHLRNNRRALDVKEFKTVVKEIDARPLGRDVRVTVRLRGKASHHERVEEAAGGFKLLVVELTPA